MTIYKSLPNEKKDDKEPCEVEIPIPPASEPLTGKKDEKGVAPVGVRVTYQPRSRRTLCNLLVIILVVLVLGAGVIGAVFLYRQLAQKVYKMQCRQYYDKSPQLPMVQNDEVNYFEETVEVSAVENYERLDVPKFDGCEDTVVWHDFQNNYTAIVDHHLELCYVMGLNRSLIAPPTDMIDLLTKFKDKYYLPRASVIRQEYRVVMPPVADLTKLGPFIMRACFWYETFMLEKRGAKELEGPSGIQRRSVDGSKVKFVDSSYGFSSFKGTVLELTIHHPSK